MKNKLKFWIVLSLVLTFAAGVRGGIFGERFLMEKRMAGRAGRPGPFPSLEKMAKDLGLSAEQQERIKNIFQKNEERFKELNGDLHRKLQAIREQLKAEIDSVLTPEQKKKMEEMIERYRTRGKRGSGDRYPNRNKQEREKGEKK